LKVPAQGVSVVESQLRKGCVSFKKYMALKTTKFGIETFELCESCIGHVWNFTVYIGGGSDITNSTDMPDNQQSLKIAVRKNTTLEIY
jgi:hypothetical protein